MNVVTEYFVDLEYLSTINNWISSILSNFTERGLKKLRPIVLELMVALFGRSTFNCVKSIHYYFA